MICPNIIDFQLKCSFLGKTEIWITYFLIFHLYCILTQRPLPGKQSRAEQHKDNDELKIAFFLSWKFFYSERPWTKVLIHNMAKHNWLQIEMRLLSHHSGNVSSVRVLYFSIGIGICHVFNSCHKRSNSKSPSNLKLMEIKQSIFC